MPKQNWIDRLEHGRRAAATAQRNGTHGFGARDAAWWTSIICGVGAAAFWIPVQWVLLGPRNVPEMVIAIALGCFMVVGMPTAISMYVPWTKTSQFMARLNLTWLGQLVGGLIAGFLLFYAGQSLWLFWSQRPVVAAGGINWIAYQTILAVIATIAVPVLLWAPAAPDEMAEAMRRSQLMEKYLEAQRAQKRLAREINIQIMQSVRQGFVNMSLDNRTEVWNQVARLTAILDSSWREMQQEYEDATNVVASFASPLDRDDTVEVLSEMRDALTAIEMPPLNPPSTGDTRPLVLPDDESMSTQAVVTAAPARPRPSALRFRPPHDGGATGMASQSQVAIAPPCPAPPRPAANRGEPQRFAAEYQAARQKLSGTWSAAELGAAIGRAERTARDRIEAWMQQGLVAKQADGNAAFYFTEPEVRS